MRHKRTTGLRYPGLWRGCTGAWAPCLGPTGLTLRDWSGFGRQGLLTGMDAGTDWVTSQSRYALDFDGTDDYVSVASVSQIPAGISPRTMSFWMYQRTNTTKYAPVSMDNAAGRTFSSIFWFTGGIYYVWSDSVAVNMTCTAAQYPPLNQWNHIALSYDGAFIRYHLNGDLKVSTGYTASTDSISSLTIGRRQNTGGTGYFDGLIDDVFIHSRVLTGNQIRLLASRRGIAYELAPRRRSRIFTGGFKACWAARKALIQLAGAN